LDRLCARLAKNGGQSTVLFLMAGILLVGGAGFEPATPGL
jgi:hypothetical protein